MHPRRALLPAPTRFSSYNVGDDPDIQADCLPIIPTPLPLSPPIDASYPALQDKLRALWDPATYPEITTRIEAIETHCAWVFLTDAHAYKLKKPMRLDRMDNLLLASRDRSCREELRLNRRLAPDVYLDVVPLVMRESGNLTIGGPGKPVEWLVKMQRLPSARMLDHAIAAHTVDAPSVRALAELIVHFYRSQAPIPMSASDYLQRLEFRIEASRRALLADDLALPAGIVLSICDRQLAHLHRNAAQFGERAAKLIEAHGDLRPEHMYLGSPPCVIDCLEFDRDLRLLDPLEELAAFSMDCERLGERWIGRELRSVYALRSGDSCSEHVFAFYLSRRATQRALTCAWHLRDSSHRPWADWGARALSYLHAAEL